MVRDFAESELAPARGRSGTRSTTSPSTSCGRWASSACSGSCSPRSGAGAAATSPRCASPSRRSAASTSRWASRCRPASGLGANPIYRFGTDDQQAALAARPRRRPGARRFGLTEPDAGSDAGRHTHPGPARRRRVGDRRSEGVHHQLRHTDHVGRSPSRPAPTTGISAFVVPAGTPGLIVEPPYRKLGWHASDTHGLTLDDCRVPADQPARRARRGLPQLPRRSSTTAASRSRRWPSAAPGRASTSRSTTPRSGTPSAARSAASRPSPSRSADLAVAVENARNLTYKAAWLKDQGRPIGPGRGDGQAVLHRGRRSTRPASPPRCSAAPGFIEETPVARFYRDAKILEIGEGTSEIQRLVIARWPRPPRRVRCDAAGSGLATDPVVRRVVLGRVEVLEHLLAGLVVHQTRCGCRPRPATW